ncbi:MAG: WD40/YVTN/BNR-like repeat-containing protein [Pyrinomonadaceae bacterium]
MNTQHTGERRPLRPGLVPGRAGAIGDEHQGPRSRTVTQTRLEVFGPAGERVYTALAERPAHDPRQTSVSGRCFQGEESRTMYHRNVKPSLKNANAYNIRKDHGHPLGVFAVTNGQGLYHSTDFGDTWTPVGDWTSSLISIGSASLSDCAVNPASPNIVFALSHSDLFKSTDGGSTFVQQFGNGLPMPAHCSLSPLHIKVVTSPAYTLLQPSRLINRYA